MCQLLTPPCHQQVFQRMKSEDPERYLRLEQQLGKTYFEARDAYSGSTKEKRRAGIAHALSQVGDGGRDRGKAWRSLFDAVPPHLSTHFCVGRCLRCLPVSTLLRTILLQEVSTVPPSRLMALIGQALKW